jgi:hypothetical protein
LERQLQTGHCALVAVVLRKKEGQMVLADLQTLHFEALIAEDKCLVDLHATLPLRPRSTGETVTIDK